MRFSLRSVFVIAVLLAMVFGGCTTTSRSDPRELPRLQREITKLSRAAKGRLGVGTCLLETGETVTVAGDERFPMQSVYKLPIAMAALHEVDAGRLGIDEAIDVTRTELGDESFYSPIRNKFPGGTTLTVRQLIQYAVSESDNAACDILLRLAGGAQRVTEYLRGLGINEVVVATSEREMAADDAAQYRNWATPRGALKMLAILHAGAGLSPQSYAVLNEALAATVTGPRRIRGLLPPGTPVRHKTGTSATLAGRTAATNDVAIVSLPDSKHLAVAVFISDSVADPETREFTIARIAFAAYNFFTKE